MKEEIKGIIPRVVVYGSFATWNYAMFITSKRIALIQTGYDYAWGWSFYLDIVNHYRTREKRKDIKEINLDTLLAEHIVNKEIPLEKLVEIKIRRDVFNRYRIEIFGLNKRNIKKKLFVGYFALPEHQIGLLKGNKEDLKSALYQYALNCQMQIEKIIGEKLTQKIGS
ncbi:MAG: hypothetical protein JSV09_12750 [Thermoplasmata archaeon]|nr:MAG: hypothetical protein JSV09_12750 [Thermoplasmata archaeon]